MLHVANGDTTLERLKAAGIEGDIISGDDILMEGPLPGGLATDAQWAERAEWFEETHGIEAAGYLARREERERAMADAKDGVVLWTESDLHCQTNLLYWLRQCENQTPLYVVCPAEDRLGELTPKKLAGLQREPVSPARLSLARQVWTTLCGRDPTRLELLLRKLDVWPAMRDAMKLHLARFPNPVTGLDLIDQTLLLDAARDRSFNRAVRHIHTDPATHGYGATDFLIRHRLKQLQDAGLLVFDEAGSLMTTEEGEAVLAGEDLPQGLPARWVGGVLLKPDEPAWQWDGERLFP